MLTIKARNHLPTSGCVKSHHYPRQHSQVSNYLLFIRRNIRLLSFGFILTCFSAFGQTFFIALFGAEFRQEFGLSNSQFGGLYSVATLSSALSLMVIGRLIDRTSHTRFAAFVCFGLATACLLAAWSPNVVMLGIALYGLRLFGQGLMSHTAMTTMARAYDRNRGKSISLAGTGVPAGEAVLPFLVVSVAAVLDWRIAWMAFAGVLIFLVLPLVVYTGSGEPDESDIDRRPGKDGAERRGFTAAHDATTAEVIRDPRFLLAMPVFLAAPFITTGIMIHQVVLVEEKGWSLAWYAATFSGFATATTISAIYLGTLVDRVGTVAILPFYLMGIAAGCLVLATVDHPIAALIFMVLAGTSVGGQMLVSSALWPELYGRKHIGAIRSMTTAMMLLATAGSPFAFGWLIDGAVTMSTLAGYCALYILVASAIAVAAVKRHRKLEALHPL